jgi:CHAD domain-containing protein
VKLQTRHVEKPFRKLRKQLSAFPSNPKPEDVHTLRTHARRLEATVAALALDQKKDPRDLIKLIKPVRKAAGKVRDMDVLIGDVLTISSDPSDEAAVRLVEHLAKMRVKSARKLHDVVRRQRRATRDCLDESSKIIRKKISTSSASASRSCVICCSLTNTWIRNCWMHWAR